MSRFALLQPFWSSRGSSAPGVICGGAAGFEGACAAAGAVLNATTASIVTNLMCSPPARRSYLGMSAFVLPVAPLAFGNPRDGLIQPAAARLFRLRFRDPLNVFAL